MLACEGTAASTCLPAAELPRRLTHSDATEWSGTASCPGWKGVAHADAVALGTEQAAHQPLPVP